MRAASLLHRHPPVTSHTATHAHPPGDTVYATCSYSPKSEMEPCGNDEDTAACTEERCQVGGELQAAATCTRVACVEAGIAGIEQPSDGLYNNNICKRVRTRKGTPPTTAAR
jgi:hypothetical protein